jgi:2-amino-4-hydroxy-6-hydroxymethyldihydropteridine diphosphokinase
VALVYLGIGSNIQPETKLAFALQRLKQIGKVQRISTVYRTEPLGPPPQNWYHNMAVLLETELSPTSLLTAVKQIEQQAGRKTGPIWCARELDVDILLYDSITIDTVSLHIPHLELPKRQFVLQPLADIASTILDPRSGKTIQQLLVECNDTLQIEKLHHE